MCTMEKQHLIITIIININNNFIYTAMHLEVLLFYYCFGIGVISV